MLSHRRSGGESEPDREIVLFRVVRSRVRAHGLAAYWSSISKGLGGIPFGNAEPSLFPCAVAALFLLFSCEIEVIQIEVRVMSKWHPSEFEVTCSEVEVTPKYSRSETEERSEKPE